jgi:kinesin family protein 13
MVQPVEFKVMVINITLNFLTAMASEPQTPAQTIDYNFAREELMLNELSNDPIQAAIARLEKQHEEDKQGML